MKKITLTTLLCSVIVIFTYGQRPNILWLTFEDSSPQYIGCYGNKDAKTPTMDMLASEGVRFTSAFSTGTVCSPSRYALITGTRPGSYGTGHHRSQHDIPEYIEAYPKYLRDAGYYTTNCSKTDYSTSRASHFIKTGWDECSGQAGWWNREEGQPFFAIFNCNHSHQSRVMTNPWSRYEEQVLNNLPEEDIIKDNDFDMPPIYHDTPEMRKAVSRVYNSIQYTDIYFAEILERLEKEGLKENTIIFCYSDHGEGMPWGKTYARGMGYRVPLMIWLPEKYQHLSPWDQGTVNSGVVDFVDLTATLLSLAGIDVPEYYEGVPLMGDAAQKQKKYTFGGLDRTGENVALSRSVSDGEYIYNHHFMPFQTEKRWQKYFDYSTISDLIRKDYESGVLNENQSYLMEGRQVETFFNLTDDTWEINDLSQDKKVLKVKDRFERKLKKHLIESRDAHFIPEYCFGKGSEMPYRLAHNEEFYPVKDVIEVAFAGGKQEEYKTIVSSLSHPNDIVRYWANIGLFTQQVLYGNVEKQDMPQKDTFAPADIFLQMLKYLISKDKIAYGKLINYVEQDNLYLAGLVMQLFMNEKLDSEVVNELVTLCKSSKHVNIVQCAELLEYKYYGKALYYSNFW